MYFCNVNLKNISDNRKVLVEHSTDEVREKTLSLDDSEATQYKDIPH